MKNIKKKMKTLREIVNDFKNTIVVFKNELKNTTVVITNESRRKYAKAIKELIPTVTGNEELANIAKSYLNCIVNDLGDESEELWLGDLYVMAKLLDVPATFVENPNPRYIKIEKFDYMVLVNDSIIEELIDGHCFHLARHKDGEVVIYDTRE